MHCTHSAILSVIVCLLTWISCVLFLQALHFLLLNFDTDFIPQIPPLNDVYCDWRVCSVHATIKTIRSFSLFFRAYVTVTAHGSKVDMLCGFVAFCIATNTSQHAFLHIFSTQYTFIDNFPMVFVILLVLQILMYTEITRQMTANSDGEGIASGFFDSFEMTEWRVCIWMWKQNLITKHGALIVSHCQRQRHHRIKLSVKNISITTAATIKSISCISIHTYTQTVCENEKSQQSHPAENQLRWHWIKMPEGIGQQIDDFLRHGFFSSLLFVG